MVVVGDGAVGLLAVLSAKQLGADRVIAMSRHAARQELAREFGAIKNGVTQEEIIETITHLAFYVGWPNAMSAVNRAKALFSKDAKKEGT